MFDTLFSYSIFGLPFFRDYLDLQFASLVWNTVKINTRFLLSVEVVLKVCVYVKLNLSCSQQQACS